MARLRLDFKGAHVDVPALSSGALMVSKVFFTATLNGKQLTWNGSRWFTALVRLSVMASWYYDSKPEHVSEPEGLPAGLDLEKFRETAVSFLHLAVGPGGECISKTSIRRQDQKLRAWQVLEMEVTT